MDAAPLQKETNRGRPHPADGFRRGTTDREDVRTGDSSGKTAFGTNLGRRRLGFAELAEATPAAKPPGESQPRDVSLPAVPRLKTLETKTYDEAFRNLVSGSRSRCENDKRSIRPAPQIVKPAGNAVPQAIPANFTGRAAVPGRGQGKTGSLRAVFSSRFIQPVRPIERGGGMFARGRWRPASPPTQRQPRCCVPILSDSFRRPAGAAR